MLNAEGIHVPALVYISGPMTGQPEHGVPVFEKARERLREHGYSVLCPSECTSVQNAVEQRTRGFHLRRDASMVMMSDEICVLPNWETSRGAMWEVAIALGIDLPIWEFETGSRIDQIIIKQFDIRRAIIDVNFDEWHGDVEPVDDDEADCAASHTPFRGASLAYCKLRSGHGGMHVDQAGRTWS